MPVISKQTVYFNDNEWKSIYDACNVFAHEEIQTTEHMRNLRGQFNRAKMIKDNRIGKIGEWGVTWAFWKNEIDCSEPDMKIYSSSNKSFDADLTYNGIDLHVKSQCAEAARRWNASWVFQKGGMGRGHVDPILHSGDGEAIFALVDEPRKQVEVYGPIDLNVLRENLREPRLEHLKKTKACLYLEDFTIKANATIV